MAPHFQFLGTKWAGNKSGEVDRSLYVCARDRMPHLSQDYSDWAVCPLPTPSFCRGECLKALVFWGGKKNFFFFVFLGEAWRRDKEGVIISFCLFWWPPPTPNTHTGSIGQKGWSGARNPRMRFPSKVCGGAFWSPNVKLSAGLVIVAFHLHFATEVRTAFGLRFRTALC